MIEDTVENLSKTIQINGGFRSTKTWSAVIGLNPKKQDGSPVFSLGNRIKLPGKGRPAIKIQVNLDFDGSNNGNPQNPKNINLYVSNP